MKIAFSTLGCPTWDLDTIVGRAVEYGYDGVDFRGLGEELEVYNLPAFTRLADSTRRKIEEAGLTVSGFSSSARMFDDTPQARNQSLDAVLRYRELCLAFDTGFIRVFGGSLKGMPREEAIKISVDTLEQMAELAGPDIAIAVETHDDWVATEPLAKVLEQVQAPNVCALWDLHHPYRLAGEEPKRSYENLGKFTRYTHVKDSKLQSDGRYRPALAGQGDIPLAELIGLLLNGGFDGYFTLEWEKRWMPDIAEAEIAFPAYAKFLRALQ